MRIYALSLLVVTLISSVNFQVLATPSFKVVFVNPGHPQENPTGNFWLNVTRYMQAAASDLKIELVTIYAHRNHILMKNLAEQVTKQSPDYVILVNEKAGAVNLIKQLAQHNLPVFMLLNSLTSEELGLLSSKEQSLMYGSVRPNNFNAGKNLINGLWQLYQALPDKAATDEPLKVLALQGDYYTPASQERKKGLNAGLAENQQLLLVDSTVANWSKQQAYQKVTGLLKRTRLDIIWAANDAMAFGAKQAVTEAKVTYPVLIGGVNWDIADPRFAIDLSFGGHVILGAYALIMLDAIHQNKLPNTLRHQHIDIFEPDSSPSYPSFSEHLKNNQLQHYDFSSFRFSQQSPPAFTIKNLESSYQLPVANN